MQRGPQFGGVEGPGPGGELAPGREAGHGEAAQAGQPGDEAPVAGVLERVQQRLLHGLGGRGREVGGDGPADGLEPRLVGHGEDRDPGLEAGPAQGLGHGGDDRALVEAQREGAPPQRGGEGPLPVGVAAHPQAGGEGEGAGLEALGLLGELHHLHPPDPAREAGLPAEPLQLEAGVLEQFPQGHVFFYTKFPKQCVNRPLYLAPGRATFA